MSTVGKATIDFEANTSGVTDELESKINAALDKVVSAISASMDKAEREFDSAGDALGKSVADGGGEAEQAARASSSKVSQAFEKAAADSAAALKDVDGDGFTGATSGAEQAATRIESSMAEAAGRAGAALDSIDGDGFGRVAGAASSAASTIDSTISGAAGRASAAIDSVDGAAFGRVAGAASSAADTVGSRLPAAAGKAKAALSDVGAEAESAFDKADDKAGLLVGSLGKVAGAAAALAGPAVIVQKGWARLTSIDEARAKLGALGNDAQTIETIMDNAMGAVKGTAFGFGDAAGQAATLVAAGVAPGEDLSRVLGLVADSAAVAGVDLNEMGAIFGKVAASNKLQGDDMAQLLDKQIGLLPVVAKQLGVTGEEAQKMVSEGKVSFQDFTDAMETMMGGGAEKMGKTVKASFDNVGAAAGRLGALLLGPIFGAAPGFLGGITAALDLAAKGVQNVLEWFQEGSLMADALKVALIGLGSAAVIGAIVGTVNTLGLVSRAAAIAQSAVKMLNLAFLMSGPGIAVAAIAGLVAAFVLLWRRSEAFRDFWKGLWDSVQQAVAPVVDWITGKFDTIRAAWEDLTSAFQSGDFGGGVFGSLMDAARGLGSALRDAASGIGESLWQGLLSIFESLVAVGGALWGAFKQIGGAVWELVQALAPVLLPILKVVGAVIGGVIVGAVFALMGGLRLLAGVFQVVAGVIRVVAEVIQWLAENVLAPLIGVIADVASWLIDKLAGAFTWVKDKVVEFIEWGSTNLPAFWDGIVGAWDASIQWLQDLWNGLWSGLQEAWYSYGQPVVDVIVNVFNGIQFALTIAFRLIGAAWEVLWTGLGLAWEAWGQPVVDWIVGQFNNFMTGLQVIWGWIKTGWDMLWAGLQFAWDTFGQPVLNFVVGAFNVLWTGIQIVLGWIRSGWAALGNGLRWVYDAIIAPVIGWVGDKFNQMQSIINSALSLVRGYIDLAGAKIRALYNEYVAPMVSSVTNGFHRLSDTIRGWKDNIIGWFSDAGSWLLNAGRNIVQGLIDGIQSLAGQIGQYFLDVLPGWVKEPFAKALGIHSPSRVFMGFGRNIGEGLIAGISSMEGNVASTAASMAETVQGGFSDNLSMPEVAGPPVGAAAAPAAGAAPAAAVGAPEAAALPETVLPAWEEMGAGLEDVRASVIDPAITGVQMGLKNLAAQFLSDTSATINPAWSNMGVGLMSQKASVIDPVLFGVQANLGGLAASFVGNVNGVINPAWAAAGSAIMGVKVGTIDPAFAGIRSGLSSVVGSFANAANGVGVYMQQMRRNTADPVRFTMNTIFSDGLVDMWNSVSDLIGTQKMAKHYAAFATGGYVRGPGGPTDDKIPALLSNREYVINAKAVERVGKENLDAINYGNVSVAKGAFTSRNTAQELMQDSTFQAVASRYAGGGIVQGSPAWEQLKRGYVWAQQISGRPYVLGGDPVNGGGTDCSGYMSSIADRIQGGAGHRQWATMAFNGGTNTQMPSGPQGFVAGLSNGFSIGVTNGGAAGGHTAGTIGGVEGLPAVNVESGGWPSRVKFGTGAAGANDSYFRTHYHLPVVEGQFIAGSGSGKSMEEIISEMTEPIRKRVIAQAQAWAQKPGIVNDLPLGAAKAMTDAANKTMEKKASEMMTDPGGSGVERWRPMAKRAMARVGFNWQDERQVNAMLAQIASESGGIPDRAQEIVDVNGTGASAGLGLLQIIPGTFAAHRDPALPNDRTNPFANMVAALRYYKARYGMDLTTMWGHGHGYHLGGVLPDGQGMFAKTALGRERVLSPRQTAAFEDLVSFLGTTGAPRIRPADETGRYGSGRPGDGLRTREVHVTQNIYSSDAEAAGNRAADRLTALII